MTHKVTYESNTATQELEKFIVVDGEGLYKVYLEKQVKGVDVSYTLDVKAEKSGVDIQAVLPHEVLHELRDMLDKSLSF